jgi:ABC-2 type transport system ATP-binding protein
VAGDAGPVLVVDSLTVRHRRRQILDAVRFDAGRGVLAVLGPNGAGKSTLFRSLAGLARAEAGTVTFEGEDLRTRAGLRAIRGVLGYQQQAPVFTNGFTVRESIRYAAWLKGVPRRRASERVGRALEFSHLTDVASRPVRRLSGGQQKRTAIAQAMVHEPRLLVLDEPTAALDPTERRATLELIRQLGKNATVLLSTHITSDLAAATDVLVLAGGEARFSGSRAEFRERADATDADVWESAYSNVCGSN